jgi:hypothetical protein
LKEHILTCTKLSHDGMFQRNLKRIGQNMYNFHSCYKCAFFPIFNHRPSHLNSCILVPITANLNAVWLILMCEEWQQIMHHRKEPQLKCVCVCVTWNFYFNVLVPPKHHTNLKVWGVTCCLVVKDVNMQKFNRMEVGWWCEDLFTIERKLHQLPLQGTRLVHAHICASCIILYTELTLNVSVWQGHEKHKNPV